MLLCYIIPFFYSGRSSNRTLRESLHLSNRFAIGPPVNIKMLCYRGQLHPQYIVVVGDSIRRRGRALDRVAVCADELIGFKSL